MNLPPYLKAGDKVCIVSPAKALEEKAILNAKSILEKWGLVVDVGKFATGRFHQFSGSDSERLADLQDAINNSSIKAIFCARGGYGTNRIIDKVDAAALNQHPKWIVGFSDITVLHNFLHQKNIASIHGTVPLNFDQEGGELALENLKKSLFGKQLTYEITPHPNNQIGNCNGQVVGGNLAILCSLCGTNTDINTSGKILFIEDVGEYKYRIDRMLWQLKKSNKLDNLAALIVGKFSSIKDGSPEFGQSIEEMILNLVPKSLPLVFNFPAGHVPNNQPIVLGANYELKITDKSVTFELTS